MPGLERRHDAFGPTPGRKGFLAQRHFPFLHFGDVEQVLNQRQQIVAGAIPQRQKFALIGIQRPHFPC